MNFGEANNELMAMMYSDMHQRLTEKCFKKCVTRYGEGDLHPGEGSCLERCTYKYLEVFKTVGQIMSEQQQIQKKSSQ